MAGCFLSGLCGASTPPKMKTALEAPIVAPFVVVEILGSDDAELGQASMIPVQEIYGTAQFSFGVSNSSFPASVKSLQVGTANGFGLEIEVVDQEGGSFSAIYEKLSRMGTASDSMCSVRWGWVTSSCDGSGTADPGEGLGDPTEPQAMSSATIQALIKNISLDYQFGTVKYTIQCIDQLENMVTDKVSGVWGQDTPVYLVDAIMDLCSKRGITAVFKKFSAATQEGTFEWKMDAGPVSPEKGPKGIWRGNDRTFMETIYDWIRPYVSQDGQDGRGLCIFFDGSPKKQLVFMSSIPPVCETAFDGDWQVGAYVINGGNCSPVISFKPNIAFTGINAWGTGGTAGGAVAGGTTKQTGPTSCLANSTPQLNNDFDDDDINTGLSVSMNITREERLARGQRGIGTAYNNMHLHALANNFNMQPITAELRVQGDPSYSNPVLSFTRFVNLLVINPFTVDTGSSCAIWSNQIEPCNEILSNANWIITGISHDIREGSYTTTLRVMLPAPGSDIGLLLYPGDTKQQ